MIVLALAYLAGPTAQEGPAIHGARVSIKCSISSLVIACILYLHASTGACAAGPSLSRRWLALRSIQPHEQDEIAFWLNAYNALVLRTVIDHYPIPLRAANYPAHSIRQIPGAFDQARHRVAGQTVTLDQIEQTVLAGFGDPRVFLALGRGALGSARLRSEVFTAELVETKLADAAAQCATRATCLSIDPANELVNVSSVFSWRSQDFITAYANRAPAAFASRSPIERAVLGLVEPKLLTTEKEFLAKNSFKMAFKPLTGRSTTSLEGADDNGHFVSTS